MAGDIMRYVMIVKKLRSKIIMSMLLLALLISMYAVTAFAWHNIPISNIGNLVKSGNFDYKIEFSTTVDGTYTEISDPVTITTPSEHLYIKVSNLPHSTLPFKFSLSADKATVANGANQIMGIGQTTIYEVAHTKNTPIHFTFTYNFENSSTPGQTKTFDMTINHP